MLDHATRWPEVPDWSRTVHERPSFRAESLQGLSQYLVSGALDQALTRLGLSGTTGAWGVAKGSTYAVRLAYDRMLVVGNASLDLAPGWHDAGYAVSDVSAGHHVFTLAGPALPQLAARGTNIDLDDPGPSAAVEFARMNAILYRHEDETTARLHVNRAQAAALWTWLLAQDLS